MNWFLIIIILLMAGGGYFEYQKLHARIWDSQAQIDVLKLNLESANAKLQLSGKQNPDQNLSEILTILNDEKVKEKDLVKQLQSTQEALTAAQAAVEAAKQAAAKAVPQQPPRPTFTTKLGTINTLTGKVYSNCRLLKVNLGNIVVSYDGGVTQISLSALPLELQKKLGFNPKLDALSDEQVATLQKQVQNAAASGN